MSNVNLTISPVIASVTVSPVQPAVTISGVTSVPSGPVGGDLAGSLPNPTVDGLQGRAVASTAPTDGQALVWNNALSQWEPGSASGGVSDGDKGDITVSGGGATWTIDNDAVTTAKILDDAVTLAKIQNITTARLLGNSTGVSASPGQVAVSSPLGFNGVSGNLEFNAPGTNGQVYYRASDALATSSRLLWNNSTAGFTVTDGIESTTIAPTSISGTTLSVTGTNTGDQFTSLPADVVLGRTTGTGAAQQITCTAAGRNLLDDADAAAQRTTLGLGTGDSPQFTGLTVGTVTFTNAEFITNSTNGRVEIRPAPTGASIHGFYTDFATANKVRIGTIRSSDNALNVVGLESATDFDIAAGYAFGLGGQASRTWYMQKNNPSGTLGRHVFTTTTNNVDHTGCFIFGQVGTHNSANRSPASQVNPMVYVYSNDLTNANDFVRIFHDQTNGTVNCGDGNLILSGATGVRINGSFGFATAPTAVQTGYTTFTNLATDRTCDANATTVDELADILGTLIEDLKAKGIISA